MKHTNDQQGDRHNREFVRLLAEHERQLSVYVHTLVPMWHDAEDVLQNTKLRLWEQFDSFQPETNFGGWATAVAKSMIQTHRKRCQRQRICFSDRLLEKISQYLPATSSKLQDERASALVECVRSLNDASRNLLRLVCSGHRRIKDIAHELGQTPSATSVAFFRIRRTLFECVQQRLQEKGE